MALQQREEVELKMRPQGIVRWVNITVSGWAPGWKHPSSFEHLKSESERQFFVVDILTIESEHHGQLVSTRMNLLRYFEEWKWKSQWVGDHQDESTLQHLNPMESESKHHKHMNHIESEHRNEWVSIRMKASVEHLRYLLQVKVDIRYSWIFWKVKVNITIIGIRIRAAITD